MFFAAVFVLAILLIAACFWREILPCMSWALLQYHFTPDLLAHLVGEVTFDESPAPPEFAANADEVREAAAAVTGTAHPDSQTALDFHQICGSNAAIARVEGLYEFYSLDCFTSEERALRHSAFWARNWIDTRG
jgi:hypothetical protein